MNFLPVLKYDTGETCFISLIYCCSSMILARLGRLSTSPMQVKQRQGLKPGLQKRLSSLGQMLQYRQ